ncbi:oxidoreductase-like domain-containing protein [Acidovorax sp. Be4]|uniref:Oxidoreductase-like domain-containing protein n=1 Tax=Acidovorax bellezanensis TaxID=2976702 RepID=A0ABT2PV07_9BURK|nr:oxidoreductase-like domain-containing protein [Acidovorax sp. Be4]MCT9813107.1 oxidoreductase-like domain-containing protein [Acidovorax sp. Be4]
MDCTAPDPAWQAATTAFARYQALALQAGVALRPAPTPPTSCCGRGCNGCVWEGFYDAVTFWIEDADVALAQPSSCGAM